MKVYRITVMEQEGTQFTGGTWDVEKSMIVEDLDCLVEYSLDNIIMVIALEIEEFGEKLTLDQIKSVRDDYKLFNKIQLKRSKIKDLQKELEKEQINLESLIVH